MKSILCFGDSNTWGLDGETGRRLPWELRWTGRLEQKLKGKDWRIIEEGLCGRTTVFEDPLREGRRGTDLLPIMLETHAQTDGVILMLGTNDCKTIYGASEEVIGKGINRLLDQIYNYNPAAKILLVSPVYLGDEVWKDEYDREFSRESVAISKRLDKIYGKIAHDRMIDFIKASEYVKCCEVDQEHMDTYGHELFAEAVYSVIKRW